MSEFKEGDIAHIVWHNGRLDSCNGTIMAVTKKYYIIDLSNKFADLEYRLRYDKVTGHMITKVKGVLSYINNMPK